MNFNSNTQVTLTAIPASGSTFAGWSGDCSPAPAGTCSVTMSAAKNVTATFNTTTPNTYALTVSKAGTGIGTVTGTGINCGSDCTESYASGTSVTLTATAASGSTFAGWSGACSGTGSCSVTLSAAKNVTATFNTTTLNTYALTVSKAGTGSGTVTGTGINCGSDCTESYASGTSVTLTATATSGSTFAGWSGACSGTGSCSVTMSAAKNVTGTFNTNTYTLTVTKAGTGSGTVTGTGINCGTDCTESYASGTSVTLTATAANGSTFAGWSGDCSGTGTCSVTMSAAKNVTATFNTTTLNTPAYLESPQQSSFESGIGLIRGWICDAQTVEIQINGGARTRVAYGTARGDTVAACGDDNNGFGYTINWNAVGNGTHRLQAFADGIEFANVTFNVTTLGVEFLSGAAGQYTLPSFPETGRDVTVRWSETHQNFVISGTGTTARASHMVAAATGAGHLESPQQGSFESGIGLIRGWICDAQTVEIQINGGARTRVAYGTARGDTVAACGDDNNGFGYTINWNAVGTGTHRLQAFADGVEFANVTFNVTTLGVDFLSGVASNRYPLTNFPQTGQTTYLRWSEAHQNFVISP